MKQPNRKLFWILATILLLVNLLQAGTTELIYDEAYYWYFSQQLDFGYFDHPPMVAFLIKIGGIFTSGTLGVRLVGAFLGWATYFILWELIDYPKKHKYIPHFFLLGCSMALLNAYGFLILPDTPLLFFTALFLWTYKRFFIQKNALNSLLLGLVLAALLYSKYNGVLIVLAALIANPSLIRNKYAWMAVGVGILAFIPHIWWLYTHDWVTVNYHLFERPTAPYTFSGFSLGYFLNLMAVFGLTFPLIYWAFVKYRSISTFDKTLKSIVYTVLIFFFLSSFKKPVQAQWIVVISIPLILIVFNRLASNLRFRKRFIVLGILNISIIAYLRLGMIWQPLLPFTYETHGNKTWVAALMEKAENKPVIFVNSYQNASMYSFYSGVDSYSLNSVTYRKNQYNLDESEKKLQGKDVVLVGVDQKNSDFSFPKSETKLYYGKEIDSFTSYQKLKLNIQDYGRDEISIRIKNPYAKTIETKDLKLSLTFLNAYKKVIQLDSIPWDKKKKSIPSKGLFIFEAEGIKNPPVDAKYMRLSISEFGLPYGQQGEIYKVNQWK